jgi:pSer/pThr/pTyr-binding forkhead associated (FHA) protein
MPARLVPLAPGLTPTIALERPVILIGRHPECDVHLAHPRISLRHCCIVQVDDRLVARDLGSTNGLWINGHRVEEAQLAAGDELALGPLLFRLEAVAAPASPPRAASPASSPIGDDDDELVPLDLD